VDEESAETVCTLDERALGFLFINGCPSNPVSSGADDGT